MTQTIQVAVIGTGNMAQRHVSAYLGMQGVEVVAGVDTDNANLLNFCNKNGIEHRFSSVEEALEWGKFEAASNVTPDSIHYRTTLPIINAGKHILCEKPLAVNYQDAIDMANRAAEKGIIHSVNLSYREVPALQKAALLVSSGAIGEVRHFEASYLQSWLTQPSWGDWKTEPQWLWRLSTQHGSNGVLGDVGIHILDFATFVMGTLPSSLSSNIHTFDKAPDNTIGEYVLDANDSFVMHAQLPNGALGTLSATRFASGHHNDLRLRVYGDKGGMEVLFENKTSSLNVCMGEDLEPARWQKVTCPEVPSNYDRFIASVRDRKPATPDFFRAAELQKMLDQML